MNKGIDIMEKGGLRQLIKDWVALESDVVQLRKQMKLLNTKKKEISDKLLLVMKEQKIDEFDLNSEGKLLRQTKVTKQSINKKTLPLILNKYYTSDEEAHKVAEFILLSRPEKVSETLRKK
jgi:hypothetical protein